MSMFKKTDTAPVEALVSDMSSPAPAPAPMTGARARAEVAAPLTHKPASMGFEIWARTCDIKADQIAGFRFWARSRRLTSRTAAEWRKVYEEFMRRPV